MEEDASALVGLGVTHDFDKEQDAVKSMETFSQHQNENVEMSVVEFGRRVAAGESLQLRLTLAEWQERNASSGAVIYPGLLDIAIESSISCLAKVATLD